MRLKAMLDDLPKACDRGTKKNARGSMSCDSGYQAACRIFRATISTISAMMAVMSKFLGV